MLKIILYYYLYIKKKTLFVHFNQFEFYLKFKITFLNTEITMSIECV